MEVMLSKLRDVEEHDANTLNKATTLVWSFLNQIFYL